MGCGADTEANTLMTSLTAGTDFSIPDVDLEQPEFEIPDLEIGELPDQLTNEHLTTGLVGGTGTFDVVMKGVAAHLAGEHEKGRITGDQYAKAFMALTESALGNSVQFLLGKDQAFWQAIKAKYDAQIAAAQVVTARVQLETAKVQLQAMKAEALNNQANYALTKMKLSTESVAYCVAQYQLDYMLPTQKSLLLEQTEAQRAQTLDTRIDGVTAVAGLLGKQKALYSQQITSYKRDAEAKVAKMYIDTWITQKTIDEGLLTPNELTNAKLDTMIQTLNANLQFDGSAHP
jgi:hypothetical protein